MVVFTRIALIHLSAVWSAGVTSTLALGSNFYRRKAWLGEMPLALAAYVISQLQA